jgi:hypothetical protein
MITATDVYVIFNANHTLESELGSPLAVILDETEEESFNLNQDSMYAIICGGKRWDVTFRRWYGPFAVFYCPLRDNVHAVRYTHVRTFVKRVKA